MGKFKGKTFIRGALKEFSLFCSKDFIEKRDHTQKVMIGAEMQVLGRWIPVSPVPTPLILYLSPGVPSI